MIPEAALIMASCVLFIKMGLADEVQARVPFRLRILTCPKCLTFWCILLRNAFAHASLLRTLAVSFGFSYMALWAGLLFDLLAIKYNRLYEKITENPGTAETEDTGPGTDNADGPPGSDDAMP